MNAIKIQKDTRFKGIFSLRWGKRRAVTCLSSLAEAAGMAPTDDQCRQAFNDTAGPGDAVADSLVPVHRLDLESARGVRAGIRAGGGL